MGIQVAGPGPHYAPLAEFKIEELRRDVEDHLLLPLQVARNAVGKVRPGGTLLFMGGTGGRRTGAGPLSPIGALSCASRPDENLALELAAVRVNLDARREQLRSNLPILVWASRAVSRPMPALPPITMTFCPSMSRSRCGGGSAVEVTTAL
jgi:hypothetical protein